MVKPLVGILVLSIFEITLSFSTAGCTDPLFVTLDQILSDVTLEILPYPIYPACPPNPCGSAYPPAPSTCLDSTCQCGLTQTYPESCNPFYDQSCQVVIPSCPNICIDPYYDCGLCGIDACPPIGCYKNIREPCSVCDEFCICFDNCACDCMLQPPPYLYFPQVEYPMSGMDLRPYYYGNCWCF